jgi:uncharacterized delta-60 repeat protein
LKGHYFMKTSNRIRTIVLAGSLLLQLSTLCFHSHGAAGDVDLSFDPGSGVNGTVRSIAVQPDGKVIIGGGFTLVKGLSRTGVARLNADGSGDPSFNANTNAYSFGNVRAIALQADGKVLLNHDSGIVRLNTNGSVDASFGAEIYYSTHCECFPIVTAIAVQANGKVIVGGDFFTENGTNVNFGLARLNPNGMLDPGFNANTVGEVSAFALQPDGKVVAAGYQFAHYNTDGSHDLTFSSAPEISSFGTVLLLAVQPDAKLLVGGYFATIHGTNRNGVARLNADGSLDNTFDAGTGTNSYISSVALQSDGKVLIGGYFSFVNGDRSFQVARLNINGTPNGSFVPGVANDSVSSLAVQSNGKVVIGGSFSTVNGTNRNSIARLNVDGSFDGSFYPGRGLINPVSSLQLQPDGKVLISGNIRLNADGSADNTYVYVPNTNFNPSIVIPGAHYSVAQCSAVQADGKVIIGGWTATTLNIDDFNNHYFSFGWFVTRVNADGSRDTNFNAAVGGNYGAWAVGSSPGSARDPWSPSVRVLRVQPDGKVLVGASFGITRLNANGTSDSNFNPGFSGSVYSMLLQPDGRVLLGSSAGVAWLSSNGTREPGFNPTINISFFHPVVVVLQPDGKVLVGGSFSTVNGVSRKNIARLNNNGSLDTSFNPGIGADAAVRALVLQPDGNVLIAGDFLTINGVVRPYMARLYGNSIIFPSMNVARSNAFVIVSWPTNATGYSLRQSTNLSPASSWTPVSQPVTTNSGQNSVMVPVSAGTRFFRLTSP